MIIPDLILPDSLWPQDDKPPVIQSVEPIPRLQLRQAPWARQVQDVFMASSHSNPVELFASLSGLESSERPRVVALNLDNDDYASAAKWMDDFDEQGLKQYDEWPAYPFNPHMMVIVPKENQSKAATEMGVWSDHPNVYWLALNPKETPEEGVRRYLEGYHAFVKEWFSE